VVIAACCLASPEQQQRKKKPANGLLGLLRRQVAQTNKKNTRARLPKARAKTQSGKKKPKTNERTTTRRKKKRTTAMQPITTLAPSRGGVGGLGALAGGAVAGSLLGGAIAVSGVANQKLPVTTLVAADAGTPTQGEAAVTSPAQDETSTLDVATTEALPSGVTEVAPQTEVVPAPPEPPIA
jgi:hypothetical protein